METPRKTRSSVLGKRPHTPSTHQLQVCVPPTPDSTPNPKRARVSLTAVDGDGNKENVPPFINDTPTSPGRLIRRASTDSDTPSRKRPSPRRNASITLPVTPATAVSQLSLSTPPPTPPTFLPIHVRARALLRATCDNKTHIAGRDQERAAIEEFVSSFGDPDADATLYISGSPGTGKTALVNSVLRDTDVNVISINCMALNSVDALWERLSDDLDPGKKSKTRTKKTRSKDAVEKLLYKLETKLVLVLDELDHIAASFQSLVSLFSLPRLTSSSVRIIGIANTHTLTSSLSQFSTSTVSGVKTLHFAPYTPSQLLEILRTRLGAIDEEKKFLPATTLMLLTKKVAAMTGDVRALFQVLRGAIDLAVASNVGKHLDPMNSPPPVVMPPHILAALKAYMPASTTASRSSTVASNSESVMKVRNLGLQSQLVILAVLLASKRLEAGFSLSLTPSPLKRSLSASVGSDSASVLGMDVGTLHAYYGSILSNAGGDVFQPVLRSEFGDLMGMLETVGLVDLYSTSSASSMRSPTKLGKRAFGRSASYGGLGNKAKGVQDVRIASGVRTEEIQRGLGIGNVDVTVDVRAEEIRAIWDRESRRLEREIKVRARAEVGSGRGGEFEDAMED